MSGHRVTDALVGLVEKCGLEVAVTLVVQGTAVSGFLTSVLREAEYVRNVTTTWQLVGNGVMHYAPDPITDAESQAIKDAWREEHGEFATLDHSFERLCLRAAVVRSGPPESWTQCHYLVIAADQVSAIAVGFP